MTDLEIYVGSKIRIKGEWHQPTDPNATPTKDDPPADPSTLTLRLYLPNGSIINYVYGTDAQPIRDSQGYYHGDYVITQRGQHRYSWLPTGNAAQPISGEFYAHEI